jgi:hypothetical protein
MMGFARAQPILRAAVHDQTLDALLQRGALLALEEFKNKRAP